MLSFGAWASEEETVDLLSLDGNSQVVVGAVTDTSIPESLQKMGYTTTDEISMAFLPTIQEAEIETEDIAVQFLLVDIHDETGVSVPTSSYGDGVSIALDYGLSDEEDVLLFCMYAREGNGHDVGDIEELTVDRDGSNFSFTLKNRAVLAVVTFDKGNERYVDAPPDNVPTDNATTANPAYGKEPTYTEFTDEEYTLDHGDVNGDGVVDLKDVTLLFQYVNKQISTLKPAK
jgi:hypothetical protein